MKTLYKPIISWCILVILTVISVYLHTFIDNYPLFIICALLIVFFKGQQIIDVFMELFDAPIKWRFLMLSYVLLIPLIISVIYIL